MNCEICGHTLRGKIEVLEGTHPSGKSIARIIADPDRDWIECEGCSRVVCHNCAEHARTGLCDSCLEHSQLFDELRFVENCNMDELEEFLEARRNGGCDG
jgi:hypothetical protein